MVNNIVRSQPCQGANPVCLARQRVLWAFRQKDDVLGQTTSARSEEGHAAAARQLFTFYVSPENDRPSFYGDIFDSTAR